MRNGFDHNIDCKLLTSSVSKTKKSIRESVDILKCGVKRIVGNPLIHGDRLHHYKQLQIYSFEFIIFL